MNNTFMFLQAVTTVMLLVYLFFFPKQGRPLMVIFIVLAVGILLLAGLIAWIRGI